MNKSLSRQAGVSFWELCFILLFIGLVVLFVLRAFPLYNEKFQVNAAINSVVSRPDATELSTADVKKYFLRNIQITNIDRFTSNNINDYLEVIKPEKRSDPRILHVKFEARNDLFSDIDLVMTFDVKKPLRGPKTGE